MFIWTTTEGLREKGPQYPFMDETIVELICVRPSSLRNEECPIHEAAMSQLPPRLRILRITGCRIRRFPVLPETIEEVYAERCDFFDVPDLSHCKKLIVLEFGDGRLERVEKPLSPVLTILGLERNALSRVSIENDIPSLATIRLNGNPSRMAVNLHPNIRAKIYQEPRPNYPVFNPARGNDPNAPVRRDRVLPAVGPGNGPQGVVYPPGVRPIAQDTQSVHNTNIQQSAKTNFEYLAEWGPQYARLPKETLVAEIHKYYKSKFLYYLTFGSVVYSRVGAVVEERIREAYSMNGITIYMLIERLWCRMKHLPTAEQKKEARKRFAEEVLDGAMVCSNGFMSRMQNVLIGFDDKIEVKLSPMEILQTRVPLTMARVRKELKLGEDDEETQEYFIRCFQETSKDLDDCDIQGRDRQAWLESFWLGLTEETQKNWFSHNLKKEDCALFMDVDAVPSEPNPSAPDSKAGGWKGSEGYAETGPPPDEENIDILFPPARGETAEGIRRRHKADPSNRAVFVPTKVSADRDVLFSATPIGYILDSEYPSLL